MITIKTKDDNDVILNIKKGTPFSTILLGVEMLIEALIKESNTDIDHVLDELKRIYERDNKNREG